MEQKDKELLLKDLSARLPYGVMVTHKLNSNVCGLVSDIDRFGNSYVQHHGILKIDEIKPYLRPMSSMTEEEIKEFTELIFISDPNSYGYLKECELFSVYCDKAIDWLNAHHFDYRGLIEKSLALKAPKGMYN